ncbi:MAG: ribonuclease J, partial [Burkholderiales bacterium]
MPTGKLQVVPLGGLGEFGMNCMAMRWGDDIFLIDAGMMFPEAELLGVDIVVPDITYLTENRDKVRAIVLTHGHEDHIGALPYVLSELNVPVYGTEFTLAYVENKLEEHGLLEQASLLEIRANERIKIGPFTINPIQVTHSLVDCVSLAIHTPIGVVIHTGDFKVDPTPTDNRLFDLHTFAEYGKEGVLALFQDSTNVERAGYTPSERAVRRKFDEVFARAEKRIFVSCFSSSIHRIKLAIDCAFENNRKVALIGRSMTESIEIAQDLGYIDIPDGVLIHPGQIKEFPAKQVCVMIAGTQGEPMSALSRAAVDSHKHAKIEPGDTVVLSSRIIPGNEKAIYRVVDHLYRRDALVVYEDGSSPPVHVSGHASQEELKLIINLVKPRYFIPIHGEYRQLKRHGELAASMKGAVGKVMMIESGDVLEFDEFGARKSGEVTVGHVCIDSGSISDIVEDLVIRDRRHLSEDGIVLPIIAINKLTGKVESSPEIVMRGFAAGAENGFTNEAREIVMRTLE